MANDLDDLEGPERRLCEALAAYFDAVKAGQVPERDALLARYPELADELIAFLEHQDRLLRVTEPLRSVALRTVAGPGPTPIERNAGRIDGLAANGIRSDHARASPAVHVFGDYELIGEPRQGGMSLVYRAVHKSLNRPVALKMLRGGMLAHRDDVRRFYIEAEAVANLDHPNIVPIYEVGEHDGCPYFAMKLIEGGSLAERLAEYQVNPSATARLMATVARPVHHAHQRGILHRDLKPSNIVIDEEGQPHVTDFGLAKRVAGDSELTRSGAILGTPAYMAPEQASGNNKAITTATDVHGLGAVLYTLMTGKPPFGGDSVQETLEQVRRLAPEPPGALGRDVDRDLETICLKCLEKEPECRYPSALALAEDLERWIRGEPIAARPVSRAERAWRWCRRNPALAVLAGATAASLLLLLAGAGVGGLLLWREKGRTQRAFELEQMQHARAKSSAALADQHRLQAVRQLGLSMQNTTFILLMLSSPKWTMVPELGSLRARSMEFTISHHEVTIKSYAEIPAFATELAEAYGNLAAIYAAWSAYAKAGELLAKAAAIHEARVDEALGSEETLAQLAGCYLFEGYYLHFDGRSIEARDRCKKAMIVFDRILAKQPNLYRAYNTFAWSLVTCPVAEVRDPDRAVVLARHATEMLPAQGAGWNTLGVALLRAGETRAALDALQKAMALNKGGDGFDWFFVAMAYQDLDQHAEALRWFDRADRWTIDESYYHIEVRNIRYEAAAYLGLPRPSDEYLGVLRREILSRAPAPSGR